MLKIIVGRFGSHFGYIYRRNRKKILFLFLIFVVLPTLIYIFSTIRNYFMPLAFSMAESKAKSVGTLIINDTVSQQVQSENVNYTALFDIQKNSSGEISAIIANTAKMNLLKSQLSTEIQKRINEVHTQQIGIPLGSMLNNEFTAGRGPNIPIKLVTVGAITIDFTSSFESAGINQTRHEVLLEIKMTVSAVLPTGNSVAVVSSKVPVAQTIIVGNVPESYTNIAF
jgi:sporulation protein YunB